MFPTKSRLLWALLLWPSFTSGLTIVDNLNKPLSFQYELNCNGKVYAVPKNELYGANTLLDGPKKWARSLFKFATYISRSLSFILFSADNAFNFYDPAEYPKKLWEKSSSSIFKNDFERFILGEVTEKIKDINVKQATLYRTLREENAKYENRIGRAGSLLQGYDQFKNIYALRNLQRFISDVVVQLNKDKLKDSDRIKKLIVEVTAWLHENYKWLLFGKRFFTQLAKRFSDYAVSLQIGEELVYQAESGFSLPDRSMKIVCRVLEETEQHRRLSVSPEFFKQHDYKFKLRWVPFMANIQHYLGLNLQSCPTQAHLQVFLDDVIKEMIQTETQDDKAPVKKDDSFYGYNAIEVYELLAEAEREQNVTGCSDTILQTILGDNAAARIMSQASTVITKALNDITHTLKAALTTNFVAASKHNGASSKDAASVEPKSFKAISAIVDEVTKGEARYVTCGANLCSPLNTPYDECIDKIGRRMTIVRYCIEHQAQYNPYKQK